MVESSIYFRVHWCLHKIQRYLERVTQYLLLNSEVKSTWTVYLPASFHISVFAFGLTKQRPTNISDITNTWYVCQRTAFHALTPNDSAGQRKTLHAEFTRLQNVTLPVYYYLLLHDSTLCKEKYIVVFEGFWSLTNEMRNCYVIMGFMHFNSKSTTITFWRVILSLSKWMSHWIVTY